MRIVAAGHRVVHGGLTYDRPVLVMPEVIEELAELVPLAPLHQPHNLAAIRAIGERRSPSCRRSPASTPRFTAPSRPSPSCSRCHGS